MTASQESTNSKKPIRLTQRAPLSSKMYCVTIYNENLRKLNGDESLRITRLVFTMCIAEMVTTNHAQSNDRLKKIQGTLASLEFTSTTTVMVMTHITAPVV